MKKLIGLLLILFIVGCEKMEYDDIDDIIDNNTKPKTEIDILESQITFNQNDINWNDLYYSVNGGVRSNVHYIQDGIEYFFFTGGTAPSQTNKIHGPSILFKKNGDGYWEFVNKFDDMLMGGIRQTYKINDTKFVFADAAEQPLNGSGPAGNGIVREGNRVYVLDVNGENLNLKTLGESDGFHHDVSIGDLDNNGTLDIFSNSHGGTIFYNNGFDYQSEELEVTADRYGDIFFSNEIVDVDNDGIAEIIESSYYDSTDDLKNGFRILKRNSSGKYDLWLKNNQSQLSEDMGGTWTTSLDLNSDGYNDLMIHRESLLNVFPPKTSFEIYYGDGIGNFTSKQLLIPNDVWWQQPNLLDVNNDGLIDLVFGTQGSGSGLRLGSTYEDGFRLENLIHINKGDGVYEKYNKELLGGVDTSLSQFIPFMDKNNNLSFFGVLINGDTSQDEYTMSIWEVTIKNL